MSNNMFQARAPDAESERVQSRFLALVSNPGLQYKQLPDVDVSFQTQDEQTGSN
jgi:hypothetical protein